MEEIYEEALAIYDRQENEDEMSSISSESVKELQR